MIKKKKKRVENRQEQKRNKQTTKKQNKTRKHVLLTVRRWWRWESVTSDGCAWCIAFQEPVGRKEAFKKYIYIWGEQLVVKSRHSTKTWDILSHSGTLYTKAYTDIHCWHTVQTIYTRAPFHAHTHTPKSSRWIHCSRMQTWTGSQPMRGTATSPCVNFQSWHWWRWRATGHRWRIPDPINKPTLSRSGQEKEKLGEKKKECGRNEAWKMPATALRAHIAMVTTSSNSTSPAFVWFKASEAPACWRGTLPWQPARGPTVCVAHLDQSRLRNLSWGDKGYKKKKKKNWKKKKKWAEQRNIFGELRFP